MYVFLLWCFPVMARLRHSDVIIPLKKSQQPLIHREGNKAPVSLFNMLLPGFHEFSARILFPKPGAAKRKRCLYAAAAAKSLQSCPTLCDPLDGSPPGSPVPGILQAGTLEWAAISFSSV